MSSPSPRKAATAKHSGTRWGNLAPQDRQRIRPGNSTRCHVIRPHRLHRAQGEGTDRRVITSPAGHAGGVSIRVLAPVPVTALGLRLDLVVAPRFSFRLRLRGPFGRIGRIEVFHHAGRLEVLPVGFLDPPRPFLRRKVLFWLVVRRVYILLSRRGASPWPERGAGDGASSGSTSGFW